MSNPFLAFCQKDDFRFGDAGRGLPPGVHAEFYGGGGKGASSTQTVSIPPEVLARYNAVNARAENVATTPFAPYANTPEAFVAPLSTSQQAGMANINALQGAANQAVNVGQNAQAAGADTALRAQAQAQGVNMAALQGIGQAQQQGTAYNQAAGQNIGNAMGSAAPFMQGNAALQQQGLAQQQGYQQAATQNIGNIAASAQPYLQGNAALQQQGYAQQQQAQNAAVQNAMNIANAGSPAQQQNMALQQAGLAQQQGYQNAATQNIGNAMGSASPYMGQMAGLTQAGLGAGQQYLSGATGLTQQAVQTGQQMGAQAQPFYTGALQAAQPFNQGSAQLTQGALQAAQPLNQGSAQLTQGALQAAQPLNQGSAQLMQNALQAAQPLNQGSAQLTQAALQSANPLNQAAQQYMGAGAQAVGPEALNYGQYMNPFLSNVVGAQQALQAQENAQARSAMQGKAIQAGAFGGDRAGIEQANLARQQSLANQATLANLLQSGYGQAQQMAAQQQGVSLSAAQANRAAQQQAAQQATALGQQQFAQNLGAAQQIGNLGQQNFAQNLGASQQAAALGQQNFAQNLGAAQQLGTLGQQNFAQNLGAAQQIGNLGQQNYAQTLGVGQGLAALGQQQYAQQLGAGAQVGQLGQQGFQQALNAGAQLGQVGQNLYNQNIGQGQALANLGQQGLAAMQSAGQNIGAAGMNLANLQSQQAQQISNIGQQALQAGQTTGTNLGAIGMNQAALQGQQGQALAGLGQQGLAALQGTGTNLGNIGQQLFGQNIAQGQAIQGLGQQQFAQGLAGAQGAAGIGQNIAGQGAQAAGIQQAGGMNVANLGLQGQAAQIGAAQAQMAAGQQAQQTDQAARTALYNQYLQQQGYPFQIAQFLANIAEGTGSLSGSTTTAQRTGQRGGRMGDGYASGGLVPPDSQGGAVFRQGAYADGGSPGHSYQYSPSDDSDTGMAWVDLNNGQIVQNPESDAGLQAFIQNGQQPVNSTSSNSTSYSGDVADKLKDAAANNPALQQNISDYQAVSGVDKDVASAFKDATGNDIDAASARKYQDMLNSGMSLDQVKYNINTSQPALLKQGDVGALKGQSLAYNPANFATPSIPTFNQYGSYAAPQPTPQYNYGNVSAIPSSGQGNYGYGGGYGQNSNYGMPNFGGAPNYAGAAQYGAQQYGYQQQPPQATGKGASQPQQQYGYQQQAPQATGKGASQPQQAYQPPQATGKGASQPAQQAPTATGKGMSTGGRAAFASGGRAGYLGGGPIPGDPYGILQAQQASFAGAPGAAMGYVPQASAGAGQYKMMTPQASILPQKQNAIKEAASMGTSVASLGDAGTKLYNKLTTPSTTAAQDAQKAFNQLGAAKQADIDAASGLVDPSKTGLFGGLFGSGEASGGRIGYSGGGIPGLDDLKQGYAAIPGGTGEDTPMGKVVSQGTQTPAELKNQMDRMSSGSGGLGGGSSSGGVGDIIKTGASLASLGNAAMSAGSWIGTNILPAFLALKRGGRVGKAGGGALIHTNSPKYHQMQIAFDNFVQRYDHNPLIAAAAMDVGPEVVDSAIKKAAQTGKDISDFLPRRTQEYMFALSKAAIGAHGALNRQVRASGGRTGYAFGSDVDEKSTGLAPAPSEAMTMDDVGGGLAPKDTGVQVASTEDLKNPDILRALRGVEGAKGDATAKNPNSTAGGLYQYVDSTWRKEAPLVGVDIKQYPTARSAPEEIQHKVADANVSRILEQNKGNVQAVPNIWYSGNIEGKLSPEGLAANKGFTQEQYNQRFFNQLGGDQKAAPALAAAPTQVAMASGLMPKTASDQPAPWETIGKKILPDAVPTDSSFWVPLIAGLGSMLASDEYRFSRRLGAGLVGGAAAYGKQQEFGLQQQKVQQEAAMNALKTAQYVTGAFTRFVDPITNKVMWKGPNGVISDEEHSALLGQAATSMGASGPSSVASKILQGPTQTAPAPTTQGTEIKGLGKPAQITGTELPAPAVQPPSAVKNETPAPVFNESKIASPNDRPMALKQEVERLTQAIATAQNQGVTGAELTPLINQRQQLQERADAIINGTIIPYDANGKEITYYKDAANQRVQDAALSTAVGKNKAEYYDEARKFVEGYPQNEQLIKAMSTVYRSLNMNRATGDMADAVGYLRSIPGLSAIVPESLATMQGGYDEATKNGIIQAFQQMASAEGQKAPKSVLAEAMQTIATPTKAPEARMALLAQKWGQLDRQNEMYADWLKAKKPDPAEFISEWNRDPEHDPEKYIKRAQEKVGVFKGAAPLAGNPPLEGERKGVINQIGEPSTVNADYLRDYVSKYPSARDKAIEEFDRRHYPGAAEKILGNK